ncbi:MAG: DsbA family protein [Patescibacteria group bacterium]
MRSLSVVIILAALIIGGAIVLSNDKGKSSTNSAGAAQGGASLGQEEDQSLVIGNKPHYYGDAKSAVTIAVFTDFQCPYCRLAAPELKKIVDNNPGKVKLVFRHFPIPNHQYAEKAGEAAEAAAAQGGDKKFWELHDKMFANQSKLSIDDLEKYAGEINLDVDKFASDLGSDKYKEIVQNGFKDGDKLNVQGTPTIYINNRLANFQSYDDIAKIVNDEIAKR